MVCISSWDDGHRRNYTQDKGMNKRIRKKRLKRVGLMYRGQWIEVNTPYSYGLGKYRVILLYAYDGNESYFTSIANAKRYVDSTFNLYIDDNIPF